MYLLKIISCLLGISWNNRGNIHGMYTHDENIFMAFIPHVLKTKREANTWEEVLQHGIGK